ncbi:hypothetical protein QAD02_012217 [Eretmocerus hayati]|uniref:Uncharacterized protein n=1 Tax=Eretmocerus hayati TaxID=131215 RepID=A0ACC2NZ01_9HYME|nr:hypothetical protein QAD02_012217 [Eretmocerus hayati]
MNGLVVLFTVILVLIDTPVSPWEQAWFRKDENEANHYCKICKNHTMCRFPFDKPGSECLTVGNSHLSDAEIDLILHLHNIAREEIVRASEKNVLHRPTREMMQLFWDAELAKIARRWAVQCRLFDTDECRNVERFAVLQSVYTYDLEQMQQMGNREASKRLEIYIQSWYDTALSLSPVGIGLATPWVTNVGCGRAVYDIDLTEKPGQTKKSYIGKAETLVCNYGRVDDIARQRPRQDVRLRCIFRSSQYNKLCG